MPWWRSPITRIFASASRPSRWIFTRCTRNPARIRRYSSGFFACSDSSSQLSSTAATWPHWKGQFVAVAAGIKGRVHGEHGRDTFDLHGRSWKYNLLRKAARPFVHEYIAVSKDLAGWLVNSIGAGRPRVNQIYNGVDPRQIPSTPRFPAGSSAVQALPMTPACCLVRSAAWRR